jgi:hypothetical protein
MPITLVTKNPLLIPPKGLWRVALVETKHRPSGLIVKIGKATMTTIDFLTMCEAIEAAKEHNVWGKISQDGFRPRWSVFDDRGVYIYLRTWTS